MSKTWRKNRSDFDENDHSNRGYVKSQKRYYFEQEIEKESDYNEYGDQDDEIERMITNK